MPQETRNYSICADVAHGGHKTAMDIYRTHKPKIEHFNAHGWLLFFSDPEIAKLESLVHGILRPEKITLPMVDVDALSVRAISIYTYGDGDLIDLLKGSKKVTINLIDPPRQTR